MRQVIARTMRRRRRREELWNGNVEPPLRTVFTDPEHIVRWAWSSYGRNRIMVQELTRAHPDLPIVRMRDRGDVAQLLGALTQRGGDVAGQGLGHQLSTMAGRHARPSRPASWGGCRERR